MSIEADDLLMWSDLHHQHKIALQSNLHQNQYVKEQKALSVKSFTVELVLAAHKCFAMKIANQQNQYVNESRMP